MEVDTEQGADHLAGGYPPGEEGEEAPEEEGSEHGAQRAEGLRQPRHRGLDVLLHVLGALLVLVPAAGQHGRHRGQDEGRGDAGDGLVWMQAPGELTWEEAGQV